MKDKYLLRPLKITEPLLMNNKQKGCFDLSKARELGNIEANQAIQDYCN